MINPWTGEERDRGLKLVEDTLEHVLERVTDGRLAAFETVKAVWRQIVPDTAGSRSRPVRLDKGILTVEVADGGVASRLRLEQRRIRAAIEEHLGHGEIAQIKLKVVRTRGWSNGG